MARNKKSEASEKINPEVIVKTVNLGKRGEYVEITTEARSLMLMKRWPKVGEWSFGTPKPLARAETNAILNKGNAEKLAEIYKVSQEGGEKISSAISEWSNRNTPK